MFNKTITIIGFISAGAMSGATSLAYGLELNLDPIIPLLTIFINLSIGLLGLHLNDIEKEQKIQFNKNLLEKQRKTILNQSEELDFLAEKLKKEKKLTKKWYDSADYYLNKCINLQKKLLKTKK